MSERYVNPPAALLAIAKRWTSPFVGHDKDGLPTDIDRARGAQWRLVIAMSAWEALVRERWAGMRDEDAYAHATRPLERPIPPPVSPSLDLWLNPATRRNLEEYFDMRSARGRDAVLSWLRGAAIDEHVDAMRLAWALRNATAHGHLSATKVREWGLEPGFVELTEHVCAVVAACSSRDDA